MHGVLALTNRRDINTTTPQDCSTFRKFATTLIHILLIDSHVAAGETNSHQTATATALSSPIKNHLSNWIRDSSLLNLVLFDMVYCGKPSKACAECRLRRTRVSTLLALYPETCADLNSVIPRDHHVPSA